MSSEEEIPPAQKLRTIAHMNKDHRADLSHILQHFLSLPSSSCDAPEMLDISLAALTVRVPSTGATHLVPFSPPLASWADRRARLVAMTVESRAALGIPSDDSTHGDDNGSGSGSSSSNGGQDKILVDRWLFPRPAPDLVVFSVCAGIYAAYFASAFGGFLEPNGPADVYLQNVRTALPSHLRRLLPALAGDRGFLRPGVSAGEALLRAAVDVGTVKTLVKVLFYLIAVPHVFETAFFAGTVLTRYRLTRAAWWAWTLSVLVEGAPAQWRFKALVDAERKKKS